MLLVDRATSFQHLGEKQLDYQRQDVLAVLLIELGDRALSAFLGFLFDLFFLLFSDVVFPFRSVDNYRDHVVIFLIIGEAFQQLDVLRILGGQVAFALLVDFQ